MVKVFDYEQRSVRTLVSVTCDKCKNNCKNSHFDILVKESFAEKPELIETVCWECWDKHYKDKKAETYKNMMAEANKRYDAKLEHQDKKD